jgi:hypothetical protein
VSEPQVISIAGLQVGFARRADRFEHWIEVASQAGWRRLLESCEGAGESPWPPSPPLQELHVEQRGESQIVALLVGRAGNAHWSLSLDIDGRTAHAPRLTYDVACRFGGPPGWLGATYQPSEGIAVEPAGADLALRSRSGEQALLAAKFDGRWQLVDDRIVIAPTTQTPAGRATIRWGFELSLKGDA